MVSYIGKYLHSIASWAEAGGAAGSRRKVNKMHRARRARTPLALATARHRRESKSRIRRNWRRQWMGVMASVGGGTRPQFARPHAGWRLASIGILIMSGAALYYGMSNGAYFSDSIDLSGADFVPGEEIYQAAEIEGENVFWLDPSDVEQKIKEIPGILDAYVEVNFPAAIDVQVIEQRPVMTWSQGGETVWVDQEGVTFPARGEIPWLLPIVVDDSDIPMEVGIGIPIDVVVGAERLKLLRPNIEMLHYDSAQGLSYQDGRNWRGYFGTGSNMDAKLAVYETLVERLMRDGVQPRSIYVADLDTTYYVE